MYIYIYIFVVLPRPARPRAELGDHEGLLALVLDLKAHER